MNRFFSIASLGQFLSVFTLTLVAAAVSPNRADAGIIMFTMGAPAFVGAQSIQPGSRFQAVTTITANSVGAFIPAGNQSGGLTTSDFTGLLYDYVSSSNIPLIEKVLIPTGTAVDSDNFAYAAFTSPHLLSAGSQYVVTAWHGTPSGGVTSYAWSEKTGAPAGVNSNVTWLNTQFSLNSSGSPLLFPSPSTPVNDFGGNLIFSTPEPASLSLLAVGGLLLVRRRVA